MKLWKLLRGRRDVLIIALVLLAALALYVVSLAAPSDVTTVVVTVGGKEALRRPLAVNAEYQIPLPDGETNVICVRDGAVYMKEANCRDGLCLRQGKVRNQAKTIVCLPHEVVVKLEGDAQTADDGLDVIIQ